MAPGAPAGCSLLRMNIDSLPSSVIIQNVKVFPDDTRTIIQSSSGKSQQLKGNLTSIEWLIWSRLKYRIASCSFLAIPLQQGKEHLFHQTGSYRIPSCWSILSRRHNICKILLESLGLIACLARAPGGEIVGNDFPRKWLIAGNYW